MLKKAKEFVNSDDPSKKSCSDNSNSLEFIGGDVNMELEVMDNVLFNVEGVFEPNKVCDMYKDLQWKLFDMIFGLKSMSCTTIETFIDIVRGDKGMFVNKSEIFCAKLYALSTQGSRELANSYLDFINEVKGPEWTIPHTLDGLSSGIIDEVDNLYKFKTLTVPYIDSWNITNEFPTISIYFSPPYYIFSGFSN